MYGPSLGAMHCGDVPPVLFGATSTFPCRDFVKSALVRRFSPNEFMVGRVFVGELDYQAQSPDEGALVNAARTFGFVFRVWRLRFFYQSKASFSVLFSIQHYCISVSFSRIACITHMRTCMSQAECATTPSPYDKTPSARLNFGQPTSHLGKFQMAISPQGVIRSTSCLVPQWGFRGRRIEWRYFRFDKIQDGGSAALLENSNGDISAADHPIYSVFGSRMGFLGSADRMTI